MYEIEKDWITESGLRAVAVIVNHHGYKWRCGYVEVSKDHPLFGIEYNKPTQKIPYEIARNAILGKKPPILAFAAGVGAFDGEEIRRSPDIIFDAHGGLTFSGSGEDGYPVRSSGWWFGFDCAHDGDDYIEVPAWDTFPREGQKRTLEYVAGECESLARQLVDFTEQVKCLEKKDESR